MVRHFHVLHFQSTLLQDKDLKLPVYLMIRRGKTTYFLDAYENTKVVELKKMLECLTRQLAGDMRLFRENEVILQTFCNSCIHSFLVFFRTEKMNVH